MKFIIKHISLILKKVFKKGGNYDRPPPPSTSIIICFLYIIINYIGRKFFKFILNYGVKCPISYIRTMNILCILERCVSHMNLIYFICIYVRGMYSTLGVGNNIFEHECLVANDGNGISFLD